MKIKRAAWALALAIGVVSAQGAHAGGGTGAPVATKPAAGGVTVPPEVAAALQQLASADYAAREEAMTRLRQLTMHDLQQTIAIQQMLLQVQHNLASEMATLTNTASSDLEAQAQIAGLLEYTDAVTRWGIDVMSLPEQDRAMLIQWGGQEKVQQILGRVYSRNEETRVQGIRELGALDNGPEVTRMLALLLNDPDRLVCLASMEVIRGRKPDHIYVDALWNLATYQIQQQIMSRSVQTKSMVIAGKQVSFVVDPQISTLASRSSSDGDVAADILVKWNDPAVGEKLSELFKNGGGNANQDVQMARLFSSTYSSDVSRNLSRLIDTYKPKEAPAFFARVLDSGSVNNDSGETTMSVNGQQERWRYSARLDTAYNLLHLTGQSPDDFGLKRMPNYGNRIGVKGSMAEEDDAVKKVLDWWKTHAKEYGVEVPATKAAAMAVPN